jgi:Flp pilus assembly protein TadG
MNKQTNHHLARPIHKGSWSTGLRGERGQSILEAALVVPVLLLLLAAVVDAARAFDAYIILTNAAREGARFAAIEPEPTISDIQDMVVVDVLGSGTNITHMADFAPGNVQVARGNVALTVTVSYNFDLWFGGVVGFPSWTLTKQAVMPAEGGPIN